MLGFNLIVVGLGLFSVVSAQETVTFTLFATDLSGCDDLSQCDAFVEVFCQSKLSDWKKCGFTKVIDNSNFPVWPERFSFEHVTGNREKWRFNILDEDVAVNDQIASVEILVDDFVNATQVQNIYNFDLNINGKGRFSVQRVR